MTMNAIYGTLLLTYLFPVSEVIDVDAIIVTHTHDDHWDAAAWQLISSRYAYFCTEY